MNAVATLDFPFVQDLPKREKSKLANLWDHFTELRSVMAEHGALVPQSFAAELLGVSPQRINQLVTAGKLTVVPFHTGRFVTENSIVALAKSERKNGRPFKIPESVGDQWRAAKRATSSK
jgi:hypothetical protein